MDFKSWFIDSGMVAKGSADQAIEGRHYYGSMRVLKESFNALVQYSFEKTMLENEERNLKFKKGNNIGKSRSSLTALFL